MLKAQRSVLVPLIAIVVAVVLSIAAVAVSATSAPAPSAQVAAQASTPTSGTSGGDWQRIKAAGKIVVGTSADYPPFEYYTPNFKMDGLDIALMQAIGKQQGVAVVFKDMAFDGLLDAMELGQIDMAIAAISNTPERDAEVDFTNT